MRTQGSMARCLVLWLATVAVVTTDSASAGRRTGFEDPEIVSAGEEADPAPSTAASSHQILAVPLMETASRDSSPSQPPVRWTVPAILAAGMMPRARPGCAGMPRGVATIFAGQHPNLDLHVHIDAIRRAEVQLEALLREMAEVPGARKLVESHVDACSQDSCTQCDDDTAANTSTAANTTINTTAPAAAVAAAAAVPAAPAAAAPAPSPAHLVPVAANTTAANTTLNTTIRRVTMVPDAPDVPAMDPFEAAILKAASDYNALPPPPSSDAGGTAVGGNTSAGTEDFLETLKKEMGTQVRWFRGRGRECGGGRGRGCGRGCGGSVWSRLWSREGSVGGFVGGWGRMWVWGVYGGRERSGRAGCGVCMGGERDRAGPGQVGC